MDRTTLLAKIESDKKLHISFLQSLAQAPSPNPPGDTRAAASVITNYLHDHNIPFEIVAPKADMPNVVSDFHGGSGKRGPRIVMNGHIDVFPAGDDSDWKHGGPWSGFNDGEHIYGRGTVDMKAGTAASVIAFTYLYAYREALDGSVALTVVSDEETGGRWGSRWLLDEARDKWGGHCMINAEPGGIQSVRFGEKGTLRMTFTITTKGAHGAYTFLTEGATMMAVRLITELKTIENIRPTDLPKSVEEHLQKPEVRATIDEIMGKGAADVMLVPTLNIGTIHGGLKVNMIPEHCTFEADVRLPIGLQAQTVLDHISSILRRYPDVQLTVQEAASNPAAFCDPDHPMVKIMADVAEATTGRKPLAIPGLGATDCKFWRYLDIPAYAYGVSPETMGATDERVKIDEFLALIKVHALSVWDYLHAT
ncbi:hypothetical protein DTO164E3_908 [Paecilomyces variotii]|nr:hypothetical protein DTO032I3_7048 [Paecilomyces variotii]KAJ9206667.1 hypothetical protein DTO164E3_908 [Paecilomyces variotii]KAJ9276650.1 hypothetical protein DTO021D3_6561 [Paecilomyces variotii]KAJ9291208.1 hypothetical protein DTO021C3_1008 [Paecilomyces variotii]KAJ9338383.1 hypothetical protein DTO027B6_9060 [Paecilomyces variotii]